MQVYEREDVGVKEREDVGVKERERCWCMRERMQVHERGYCCQGEKGYWCVKKDKGCTKLYERKDVGLGVRERVWVGVGMRERVLVCKRKRGYTQRENVSLQV